LVPILIYPPVFFIKQKIYNDYHDAIPDISLWEANAWFEKALAIDSSISLAYFMQADAYWHYSDIPDSLDFTKEIAQQQININFQKALQLADLSIQSNPVSPWNFTAKANILTYLGQFEKVHEVLKVKEKTSTSPQILKRKQVFNRLMAESYNPVFDSSRFEIKKDSANYAMIEFWTGKNIPGIQDPIVAIDSMIRIDRYLDSPFILNWLWQNGNKKRVRELAEIMDQNLAQTQQYFSFLYLLSEMAYHIPFEMDDMPILKQRLQEAGIDPGFYKPMPVFRKKLKK